MLKEKTRIGHTPEPWKAYGFTVLSEQFRQVADCNTPIGTALREEDATVEEDQANARRIAACVNACALIPTEELERCIIGELIVAVKAVHLCGDAGAIRNLRSIMKRIEGET